ncbi:MAG: HEPN domain-containing protein [Cyclobacteriaceae bacterium]|nr:HEPN domain-containing protein [Cyclobacteriaceae bacterium]
MQSFRTELENPVVERDILELEKKIRLFKEGKVDEEKFRSLRLARGVYGQRQPGVQMIRIKLPYGKITSEQLERIAAVSDEYSTGNLHITTRQDIQIHYVSLDRTPELWADLEKDNITLREACGNTVRNVVASETAGIDPKEPFDVTPYAQAFFSYFLRNPVCQEMGRKFKVSFSSSEDDTGLAYIHDLGFIPVIIEGEKGFRVYLGGGLGSQPRHADKIYDFLPTEHIIPFAEAVLRVFDRYGERARRLKARLKFLIKEEGIDVFLNLLEEERKALKHKIYPIEYYEEIIPFQEDYEPVKLLEPIDESYYLWKSTNVLPQKQKGLYAIGIKVNLGNFTSAAARSLAYLIKNYAGNELRFSLRQNILIRNIREDLIPFFYQELRSLGFTDPGYNRSVDITACPGTDTCNLGIASSTGITLELERLIAREYSQLISDKEIVIKISGCMNSCGQHMMAHIGFQGMSINAGKKIAPALQVLLGGGTLGEGRGRFADKIIKIPSKKGPDALRVLLDDFYEYVKSNESFLEYYDRRGKNYFYDLLKRFGESANLSEDDFIDWGHSAPYLKEIGTGECAGVVIDLVATLLLESEEKLYEAERAFSESRWADSIYHSYTVILNTAKALLTSEGEQAPSHHALMHLFNEKFVETGRIEIPGQYSFNDFVLSINKNEPSEEFAKSYFLEAKEFLKIVDKYRLKDLENEIHE